MNTATAKALIPAELIVEIPAGDYYILPTTEMAAESIDWPLFDLDEDTDPVEFEDGTTVAREFFDRCCAVLDRTHFSGSSHGFHFGISLRRADEIDADVLRFLIDRKAIAAHTVAEDSILVFPDTTELFDRVGIPEETVFALISDAEVFDVYIPLQELDLD